MPVVSTSIIESRWLAGRGPGRLALGVGAQPFARAGSSMAPSRHACLAASRDVGVETSSRATTRVRGRRACLRITAVCGFGVGVA